MKFGIDALGGARYKDACVKNHLKEWGFGIFSFVDGFGDGLPVVDAILKKKLAPWVRVHLMWKDLHDFKESDVKFVQKEAKRLKALILKYPDVLFYVSPICEHKTDAKLWWKFANVVKKELFGCKYQLVNAAINGTVVNDEGVINEIHHGKPKGKRTAFSYDGANAFDSDVETDKSTFRAVGAEYFMFWNCQFNGRKKLDEKTKRKDRKAWPVKEQFQSLVVLAEPKGGTANYTKGLICKSHSDQHDDKPQGKDQKPVYITPMSVAPNTIQLMRGANVVAKSTSKQPYNEKKPDGTNGKQVGWRYYFAKWGYQIATEPLELWGQGRLAIVNPAFRDFSFR